ncbi:hypothetical protein [Paenibacillus sp. MBLB4367]|uniref:hypothetical protein n=1 Tax=Paenibacillus sp. MBLB4367 TaxID=3384767 RepID=UPI00390816CC
MNLIDKKQMIESIVREVLRDIAAETSKPQPKVLYVLCDSTAQEAFTDHFILLSNHGVCCDLLFLDGETSAWLGMHKLECGGAGKVIAADEYAPLPLEVPKAYDGIVIPEIDLDNAARVVLGMKGTVKAEIIFAALVLGKFVLVGEDAPGMKRADRRTLQTLRLPEQHRNLFGYYQKELQDYGVVLAPQSKLAELAVLKCGERTKAGSNEHTGAGVEDVLRFEGRLLGAEWVKGIGKQPGIRRVMVGKRTIVSSLALDMLRDRGIAVDRPEPKSGR